MSAAEAALDESCFSHASARGQANGRSLVAAAPVCRSSSARRACFRRRGFHLIGMESDLRSRSAAKASAARMSSSSKSGISARISDSVIPDAKYSRTSETVILSPRMQGLPPLLSGSKVMRSKRFMRQILVLRIGGRVLILFRPGQLRQRYKRLPSPTTRPTRYALPRGDSCRIITLCRSTPCGAVQSVVGYGRLNVARKRSILGRAEQPSM